MKKTVHELTTEIENLKAYVQELKNQRTNLMDAEAGRRDCRAGIYDKWYRHHRKDEGQAYDQGWTGQNATTQNKEVQFI